MSAPSVLAYRQLKAAKILTQSQRTSALPRAFGARVFLRVETAVYNFAGNVIPTYFGGYWEFVRLADGGFYMHPQMPGLVRVQVEGNGYSGEMTDDATGIVVCMLAYSNLSFALEHDTDALERIVQHFYKLREYLCDHPEASEILRAID